MESIVYTYGDKVAEDLHDIVTTYFDKLAHTLNDKSLTLTVEVTYAEKLIGQRSYGLHLVAFSEKGIRFEIVHDDKLIHCHLSDANLNSEQLLALIEKRLSHALHLSVFSALGLQRFMPSASELVMVASSNETFVDDIFTTIRVNIKSSFVRFMKRAT